MTSTPEELPHTAITSWSGFIYQGKIAIFYALKLLCEDKNTNKDYTLQLDSLEDFAFLNGADIISMHQVKARKSKNFSTYQSAINSLKEKGRNKNCGNIIFHIAQEILDKDVTSIELDFTPVKICQYNDNLYYCSLDQIDVIIEQAIRQYFQAHCSSDAWRLNADYLKRTRCFLDEIILRKVIQIHSIVHQNLQSEGQAAYQQTINLSDIIGVLDQDLNQMPSNDAYYFYQILGDFQRYYQKFCVDLGEDDRNALEKLSHCIYIVGLLKENDMVRFIQNIMPHRIFKFESLSDYKDSLPQIEIRDAFLRILNELKKADFNDEKRIFYWNTEDHGMFSPTTIIHGQSSAHRICQDVIENALDTDLGVMYENSNLITVDINVDSILDGANHVAESGEEQQRDKRITNWKKVSLISLENAKVKIND